MKNRIITAIILTFAALSLTACQPINFEEFFNGGGSTQDEIRGIEVDLTRTKTDYTLNEEFSAPYVNVLHTKKPKERADERYLSYEGFDSSTLGDKRITVKYEVGEVFETVGYTIIVGDGTQDDYQTLIFTSGLNATGYSSGNYGVNAVQGINFCYYRAVINLTEFVTLLPLEKTFDYIDTVGGCVGNVSPIKDIKSISIEYSSNTGDIHPTLSYGERNYKYTVTIPFSTEFSTFTIRDFQEAPNYFQICGGSVRTTIVSITVKYSGLDTINGSSFNFMPAYENSFRVVPDLYDFENCVSGVTQGTAYTQYIPTDVIGSQKKTYTYYSFDYVMEHPEIADEVAMTDPIDVANYITIFKEPPANFVWKDNYADGYSLFGNKTRCKFLYNRTDGYATAIENVNAHDGYYELDIALSSSYNVSSRGVGRLVCWIRGISSERYNYGAHPVCHYTDDHYSTFQEYDNGGHFLQRFSVEIPVNNYIWSPPINHL